MEEKHEECGVFGVYAQENRNVAHTAYYGLYALQHRGQESSGIAVAYADKISYHKGMGLVADVFANGNLEALPEGDIAIGHVRYSTTGASQLLNAQPVVFSGKCGKLAVAHNGNITNTKQLRNELIADNAVFQTSIDSEVIAVLINSLSDGDVIKGVKRACAKLQGSYALTIMTTNKLIAVRDPYGIRPLCIGTKDGDVIIASETCALDAVGANFIRDVKRSGGQRRHPFLYDGRRFKKRQYVYIRIRLFCPSRFRVGRLQRIRGKKTGGETACKKLSGRSRPCFGRSRFRQRCRPWLCGRERYTVRGSACQKPLRRQNFHSARPASARKQFKRKDERTPRQRSRQKGNSHRRQHSPRHYDEKNYKNAQGSGRNRSAYPHMLAGNKASLPFGDRHSNLFATYRRL